MGERPPLSRGRVVAFSLIMTLGALAAFNGAVELAERQGWIDTHRLDDRVQFIHSELFQRTDDGSLETTPYAESFLVPSRFAADKGDGWRMFVLGASFAMGTPYTHQGRGVEAPGGIASWVRANLQARHPDRRVEVVNVAAGAQTSYRVRRIAEEVVGLQPDVLFVATGNNEGPPIPSQLREGLHRLGGYRLLTRLILPEREAGDRPLYTPQLLSADTVREQYRENVTAILDAARERDVPVLLSTLPINLLYRGQGASVPEHLREQGILGSRRPPTECVQRGIDLVYAGKYDEALAALPECHGEHDLVDAPRWIGLALLDAGEPELALQALEASVELRPRNRTRPSLNAIVRELAAERRGVTLVDLDQKARDLSPDGLPGDNLFVDYCHLHWPGYAHMAQEVLQTLRREHLDPGRGQVDQVIPWEEQARIWGLPPKEDPCPKDWIER